MMQMMVGNKKNALFFFLFLTGISFGQTRSGKIVYERKTNLEKKFSHIQEDWIDDFLAEHKYKTEMFDLYFTDSCSVFKPLDNNEQDPISWATNNNTVYQNFNSDQKLSRLSIGGEELIIKNNIAKRDWKITDSKRKIGIYECRKAIWQMNDSTRIYAWFSNEILPMVGPEGFNGLPGAILGLATEDGGVVYFAKSIEFVELKPETFNLQLKKKKTYSLVEFQKKMMDDIGDSPDEKKWLMDLLSWL